MAKRTPVPDLFIVYYMNQEKVFETRMLLDNQLKTSCTNETTTETTKGLNAKGALTGKVPFLANLRGDLDGNIEHGKQRTMIDTLEYINTKSRMLADIIEYCSTLPDGTAQEGALVYVENVSLSLLNESEVRGLIPVMMGTFDGLNVPQTGGLDLGHMLQSIVKAGASFKMRGKLSDNNKEASKSILLKIPIDGSNLFESRYSIDDLLIGKVGVVGIYKGKVNPNDLRSSFEYFQSKRPREPREQTGDGFIEGAPSAEANSTAAPESKDEAAYIDVLAIIQAVKTNGPSSPC